MQDRPAPPVRGQVRGAGGHAVEFQARPAYDLLISLTIGTGVESDLLPEDRTWLENARGALTPDQLADLDASFGPESEGLFHGLASVVVADESLADPVALGERIASMSAREVTRALLLDVLSGAELRALGDRALDGDRAALAQVDEIITASLGSQRCDEVLPFLRDPGPAWARAQRAIAAWLPHFLEISERIARLQAADIATHTGEAEAGDPGQLIERVTGGLRWLPDPGVRRVLLAPSYFARPFNYIYQGTDWRLFCYPIADAVLEAADRTAPPAAMVRLYRALGDPTRMRILRLLADRDWYLTELATQLDLSKPTTKHHLALLRAAGLVTVTEEGNLTYYSIRRDRIEQAGAQLTQYLA
ncbi:MAG: metalloregulator ArsR/SmtB family transcription factor [Chloroflexota bacterium]